MKKIVLLLLLFIPIRSITAQTNDSIAGIWYVENVIVTENLSQDQTEQMKELVSAFSKSSFNFEVGGKFSFDFPYAEMKIPEGKWSYDSNKNTINVTEVSDSRSVLMIINVVKDTNGEMYFHILETPLKLKMKKQN